MRVYTVQIWFDHVFLLHGTVYDVYASELHILYHNVEKRAWFKIGVMKNETTRLFGLGIYPSTRGSMILIHTKRRPVLGRVYSLKFGPHIDLT